MSTNGAVRDQEQRANTSDYAVVFPVQTVHPLGGRRSQTTYVSEPLAGKIKIKRWGEGVGGFQRPLRLDVVQEIARAAENPAFVTDSILVARIDHELYIIDGQHRLEGWKLRHYALAVTIVDVTLKEARDIFSVIDSKHRKLTANHQLGISQDEHAVLSRKLGVKHDVAPRIASFFLSGAVKATDWRRAQAEEYPLAYEAADLLMAAWLKDKRWKNATVYAFRKPTVIRAVAKLVRDATDKPRLIRSLLEATSINWTLKGTAMRESGSTGEAAIKTYITDKLMRAAM